MTFTGNSGYAVTWGNGWDLVPIRSPSQRIMKTR